MPYIKHTPLYVYSKEQKSLPSNSQYWQAQMQLKHLFSSKVFYITFNFTHVSDLLYICAAQYLEFDGKLFCLLLYTYNGVCLIHIWHVLIWNFSDMGVKL